MRCGMGEDLEAVAARDADSVMPAASAVRTRERGRRRHGDDDGRADHRRLLHHLDRDAAGSSSDQPAAAPTCACARRAPASLSSALWRPDVLAQRHEALRSGVQKPAACTARVSRLSACAGASAASAAHDLVRRETAASPSTHARRLHRLAEAVDAAEAAAGRPGEVAPARGQRRAARLGVSHMRSSMPSLVLDDLEVVDVVERADRCLRSG